MDAIAPRISPLDRTDPSVRRAAAPPAPAAAVRGQDSVEFSLPAAPPPELLREVAQAGAIAEQLARNGRELHFRFDEESKRVIVEVRDLEGAVLRTIPPSHALAALSGRLEGF